MREAWPYVPAKKFLLCDHDSKFSRDVIAAARTLGSEPIRTAFRSPWQNGVAERWVGSCRCDLLDHVIVLNERHLKVSWATIFATTTKTEPIWAWPKTLRKDAQSQPHPPTEAGFDRLVDSAACITVTPRQPRQTTLCLRTVEWATCAFFGLLCANLRTQSGPHPRQIEIESTPRKPPDHYSCARKSFDEAQPLRSRTFSNCATEALAIATHPERRAALATK